LLRAAAEAISPAAESPASSWEESGDASRLAAIASPNGIDVLGEPGAVVASRRAPF
jgi:hypothetical protein